MANINAPDIKYFESYTDELRGKFQRVKTLVSHRATSGNYHEEILRTVIKNFLTKRYSVKTGFIFKGPGEVSNQIDIMIVDENEPAAYIFQEGDFAIVLPEAVRAVIEVKTTLNAQDFDMAIENIASAKRLRKFPVTLTSILFGYDGTIPSDRNLDFWFRRDIPSRFQDDQVLGPDAIYFFTAGCLLTKRADDGRSSPGGKHYHKLYRDPPANDVGWQLSILLAMIINGCESDAASKIHTFPENIAIRLIQGEGGSISSSRFAFGKGLSHLE